MYTGLYVIVGITCVLLTVVILSFLGPEQGGSGFWQTVQKIRAVMDSVCYGFMNFCAVSSILIGIFSVLKSWLSKSETAIPFGSLLAVGTVCILIAVAARSILKSQSRGELCECTGNCSTCRIRCRTNPSYYGIQKNTQRRKEARNIGNNEEGGSGLAH